jgi:hypothetical protein
MKRFFRAAAFVVPLLFAPAASAVTVWQGEAVVTVASGNCTFPGDERRTIGVGTVLKTVLRPKNVDNNGPASRISFIHDSGAMFVMYVNNPNAGGDYAGYGSTHSGLIVANRVASFASFLQAPPTVAANTIFVRLSGTVEDFMFLVGCTASFRASYSKR